MPYNAAFHENNNKESLTTYELKDSFEEPIGLMETFHPEIFIVQDKKKTTLAAVVEEEDTLGEKDIEAINAIRFQRGQKPFR